MKSTSDELDQLVEETIALLPPEEREAVRQKYAEARAEDIANARRTYIELSERAVIAMLKMSQIMADKSIGHHGFILGMARMLVTMEAKDPTFSKRFSDLVVLSREQYREMMAQR